MARRTAITYFCDACEEQLESGKALRKFTLTVGTGHYSVTMELCGSCEGRLLGEIEEYVADEKKVNLFELRRAE